MLEVNKRHSINTEKLAGDMLWKGVFQLDGLVGML